MAERISGKILVVDDDKNIRFLCLEVLSLAGYHVKTATNGIEALEMLKDSEYDLVITDLQMPCLDGFGLYNTAIKRNPLIKDSFLFMTSDLSHHGVSSILEAGKKCFPKPFRIKDLLIEVDMMMINTLEMLDRKRKSEIRTSIEANTLAAANL
ncbi:MAG: response regulator [Deltaproteobacteria bacterium]|nr:response regulator [Deltaproteobacteria bacterium]